MFDLTIARFTEDFTNHLQNHYMILNKFRVYLLYLHVHVCNMAVESATKDHCNAKKGRKTSDPDELIFLREQVRLLSDRVSLVEAFARQSERT